MVKVPKGFTLVEVMIVACIIALLGTLAVPNVLRARVNADEAASMETMKTLSSVLESFRGAATPSSYPGPGVTASGVAVSDLAGLAALVPPYVDRALAGGRRQGYAFTYAPGSVRVATFGGVAYNVYDTYTLLGNPVVTGITGNRGFFMDQTGVLRAAAIAPAGPNDLPVE